VHSGRTCGRGWKPGTGDAYASAGSLRTHPHNTPTMLALMHAQPPTCFFPAKSLSTSCLRVASTCNDFHPWLQGGRNCRA
jgi:hypothetical protein